MNILNHLTLRFILPILAFGYASVSYATPQFTGRVSVLGALSHADADQVSTGKDTYLHANQQGLRLMLDDTSDQDQWSVHLRTVRQYLENYPTTSLHSSDLFRVKPLSNGWTDTSTHTQTKIGYVLDRAVYRTQLPKFSQLMNDGSASVSIGRQPIDWGAGRFWQPMNVFGGFAPTDLDTEFKPGIDAATLDIYPSAFSSLTAAYVLSSDKQALSKGKNNLALHYRAQVGDQSELSLLAADVLDNRILGGALETSWQGIGLRWEGTRTHDNTMEKDYNFWVAGLDYQFDNGTLIMAEVYDNERGAEKTSELNTVAAQPWFRYGLQPQLSRHVAGVSIQKDVTPLWQVQYLALSSWLKDNNNQNRSSWLHQINATYSLSNESSLLLSALFTQGKGLNSSQQLQSEFGAVPVSVTAKFVMYF
ncbi:hypothetical protein [Hydrogenovibrio kuenenii]|uniref:hypothetical protein n=1 Tax=Hydrogenovibrio kuenenii TaxID=63658 RepID=UPI000465A0D8|nr:hypothetical protein [Hydrogenovibrio kuenenii]